jgi:hypothetical protein
MDEGMKKLGEPVKPAGLPVMETEIPSNEDTRLRESQATLKETLKNTAENFESAEGQK